MADARFALEGVPRKVATPVPSPDTPVEIGNPVQFVRVPLVGVPMAGVTNVGDVSKTGFPVPVGESDWGAPVPVDLPITAGPVTLAIFASVTALFAIVAANDPVPEPVTSPVSVMVWSPVFVPDRFEPATVPTAATLDGVMAPRASVIAGVVLALATDPDTPLAETTLTVVTVPDPPPPELSGVQSAFVRPAPRRYLMPSAMT
jgi:hypothetical protein